MTESVSLEEIESFIQCLSRLEEENHAKSRIYKRLYKLGKSLNETLEVDEVYHMASGFATGELGFEKCIIFQHDDRNGWFRIVHAVGYQDPTEQRVLKIINLLLSGEVIEYLRVTGEAIVHTQADPNRMVEKLTNSLFLSECTLELFGGDVDVPFGLIIAGNGFDQPKRYSRIGADPMRMLALGNFIVQLSNSINNTANAITNRVPNIAKRKMPRWIVESNWIIIRISIAIQSYRIICVWNDRVWRNKSPYIRRIIS
jgi:hypothetical protein